MRVREKVCTDVIIITFGHDIKDLTPKAHPLFATLMGR